MITTQLAAGQSLSVQTPCGPAILKNISAATTIVAFRPPNARELIGSLIEAAPDSRVALELLYQILGTPSPYRDLCLEFFLQLARSGGEPRPLRQRDDE